MGGETQTGGSAKKDKKANGQIASLVEGLATGSRRERQQVAQSIALVSKDDADKLLPFVDELIDALNRPEAQTRWEILDALTAIVPLDAARCEHAIVGAETALFDEDSGPLRLAAMCFLCKLGSMSQELSDKTWPLIDEGIQCYHGDLEFLDMLSAVVDFSKGDLSPAVRKNLVARMKFDAANSKGTLGKKAVLILENVGSAAGAKR